MKLCLVLNFRLCAYISVSKSLILNLLHALEEVGDDDTPQTRYSTLGFLNCIAELYECMASGRVIIPYAR